MDYITRHIGPDTQETEAMLAKVGYDSLEALTTAAIPADLLLQRPLDLPAPLTEYQAQDRLRELASKNVLTRFAGPGLAEVNGILSRVAMKSFTKRFRRAWIGKMLPLGLGAIAGTAANRKLADHLMDNIAVALGTPPSQF